MAVILLWVCYGTLQIIGVYTEVSEFFFSFLNECLISFPAHVLCTWKLMGAQQHVKCGANWRTVLEYPWEELAQIPNLYFVSFSVTR